LGEAPLTAECRHAIARLDAGVVGRFADHAGYFAAGNERQRGFVLILAARLEELRERDASGTDVDHHAAPRGHRMRRLGLWDVDKRQRRLRPGQLGDLDRPHAAADPNQNSSSSTRIARGGARITSSPAISSLAAANRDSSTGWMTITSRAWLPRPFCTTD